MNKQLTPKKDNLPVDAELAKMYEEDAGLGVSTKQEDNLVPMIRVIQTLSPQLNKKKAEFIEGAEVGDILLKGQTPPIVKGDVGFEFVPAHFTKDYVEWVPRDAGGGLVARHKEVPKEAKETKDAQNPNRKRLIMPNGNEIIETRYHIGFIIGEDNSIMPYVIPFASTGHTVSKQWMFTMNSKRTPKGMTAPSWAHTYRIKTKDRSNAAGDWSVFDISSGRLTPPDVYKAARDLHRAFSDGEKDIEREEDHPQQQQQTKEF